jgi:hypothetical protein
MHGTRPDEIALLIPVAFFALISPCAYGCEVNEEHMHSDTQHDHRASDDWPDVLGPFPELPSPNERWTVRRKAAVIEAVRGGWMPIEEACRVYNISVDEFLAWERDLDRNGVPGLRSTRYQIYRDTDMPR